MINRPWRDGEKGKERIIYMGKEMVFRQTREVVCRIRIQVYIEVRKRERRVTKSREAVGGHERLLTESNPNDGHLGMSTVRPLSTGRSDDRPTRLAIVHQ
jgi:hypothetical protein